MNVIIDRGTTYHFLHMGGGRGGGDSKNCCTKTYCTYTLTHETAEKEDCNYDTK